MLRQRAAGSAKGCRRGWPAMYLVNRQACRRQSRNAGSEYKMDQDDDKVSRGTAIREPVCLACRPHFPEQASGADSVDV